jgi:hypothetical protein
MIENHFYEWIFALINRSLAMDEISRGIQRIFFFGDDPVSLDFIGVEAYAIEARLSSTFHPNSQKWHGNKGV